MIRDPSDGSVKPAADARAAGIERRTAGVSPVIDSTTSGLQTGSTKPENIAKLEKSREWLKQYRENPLQFRSGQPIEGN
jgi:hypothetical protein